MTFLVQALLATLVTALLILWLRRPAHRFGLVDHHGGRKRHGDSVPLTGGIALTLGFFVALSLSFHALAQYEVLFVAMALLAAVGVLDDLGEVSPRGKLGVQVIAAVLMTSWGDHFLLDLGNLFDRGDLELRNWGIPLTVFATVAVINGINMLDGLDGLAGGLVFVMLAFFAGFAGWLNDVNALKLLLVMMGALGGFLLFNLPHPWRGRLRTFMGDTGSLVLGLVVAWFSIDLSQRGGVRVPPVVMLWVVGIVLLDLFTVTLRRVIRRRDPAAPDRAHIHHLLVRRGYGGARATLELVACNAAFGVAGTVLWSLGVPDYLSFAGFLLLGLAYLTVFLFPTRFWRPPGRRRTAEPELEHDAPGSGDKTPTEAGAPPERRAQAQAEAGIEAAMPVGRRTETTAETR
ncbi:MAG TPA: MraY family glycosyltransferase [Burkholderiaceae bacterium]